MKRGIGGLKDALFNWFQARPGAEPRADRLSETTSIVRLGRREDLHAGPTHALGNTLVGHLFPPVPQTGPPGDVGDNGDDFLLVDDAKSITDAEAALLMNHQLGPHVRIDEEQAKQRYIASGYIPIPTHALRLVLVERYRPSRRALGRTWRWRMKRPERLYTYSEKELLPLKPSEEMDTFVTVMNMVQAGFEPGYEMDYQHELSPAAAAHFAGGVLFFSSDEYRINYDAFARRLDDVLNQR